MDAQQLVEVVRELERQMDNMRELIMEGRDADDAPPVDDAPAVDVVPADVVPVAAEEPAEPELSRQQKERKELKDNLRRFALQDMEEARAGGVEWDDVVGSEKAKRGLKESLVLPVTHPELFDPEEAVKAILLYGPPGTGKTTLVRIAAAKCNATFLSISSDTMSSRWAGEEEQMVAALFEVAYEMQPSVVFIDELDTFLGARKASDSPTVAKVKSALLTGMDGFKQRKDANVVVIGASNFPYRLDKAAISRFGKRLHVPLPNYKYRFQIMDRMLSKMKHDLTDEQRLELAQQLNGYSGRDLKFVFQEARLQPARTLDLAEGQRPTKADMRAVSYADFEYACKICKKAPEDKTLFSWHYDQGSGYLPPLPPKAPPRPPRPPRPPPPPPEPVDGVWWCCFVFSELW